MFLSRKFFEGFSLKVLYIHDFQFYHKELSSYTSVGMPEKYFDRFFDSGCDQLEVVSRGVNGSALGFVEIVNKDIIFPFYCKVNYLSLFSVFFLFQSIKALQRNDLVVINTPSIIGFYFFMLCWLMKAKYVIEFAADLNQFESKRFGLIVTFLYRFFIKKFLSKASGSTYVSNFLYEKYPSPGPVFVGSNVILESIVDKTKKIDIKKNSFGVCFVGGLTKRKGVLEILKASKLLNEKSDVRFVFHLVGGHADTDWYQTVEDLGIKDYVIFHGILTTDKVHYMLLNSDIYVQPSYSEGLPRATIEAMGCALPIISTNLPGFYELVDKDFMIDVGDYHALANMIYKLLSDQSLYKLQSELALKRSRFFLYSELHASRVQFYRGVINAL